MNRTNAILLCLVIFIGIISFLLWNTQTTETPKTESIQPLVTQSSQEEKPFEERVIAKIDGEPIMASEVEERIDGFTGKFKEINPEMKFPEDRLAKMRKEFLDRIIKDKILEKAASKADIKVTDADIDERIEQFQKIFGQGEEAKKRFLGGITDMSKFRQQVEKQIRIDRFLDKQMAAKVEVTDTEIQEYYKSNPDLFKAEEEVKARHILWKLPSKDAPDFEQKKIDSLKQAEATAKELKAGADFVELVKKYSQDEATAAQGGDLGWVQKGRMVKPFEDVAFGLKLNEISDPVETNFGIHLIQVLEKKESRTLPFDEVKDKVKNSLEGKKKQALRESIYNDLKEDAKIEINL